MLNTKNKIPDYLINRIPKYEKIEAIPQAFEDSTHQLWHLQNSNIDGSNHVLKACSNTESPFWQIMDDLFDFDLQTEIAGFADTYLWINKICSLKIPEVIMAEALDDGNAYILTSELNGQVINDEVSNQMVQQLAFHLLELHTHTRNTWGSFNNPSFDQAEWSKRLEATLRKSSEKWGGAFLQSDKYLKQALESISNIEISGFVALMPDLRWDQFLQQYNELSALVDLDAFVFAPRELDFVILEIILSSAQLEIFSENYSRSHAIPAIEQVRPAYRLLLFYMQILGEADLETWMNKKVYF